LKQLRWQILIVILALAVIGVLLLGQQPPSLQPNTTVAPVAGGVYTEAIIGAFGRPMPVLDFYNQADRDLGRLIYSGLVRFDDRGLPQADLAESWGISQDGTVYNFSLRPGLVWHDGKPLTSDDVAFTIQLLRSPDLPVPDDLRALWQEVEVKVLDERTLQFRLPEPFAPFLDYLSFGVLPEHLLEAIPPGELTEAEFNLHPVGSGPFRFERLITENGSIQGVVLSKFKDYYGNQPYLDQVVFRYYLDAAAAFEAYRQKEVLGISQVTPEILGEALKTPDLNLYTGRLPQLALIFLNLDDPKLPFFQDAGLRRALLMGIHRQRLVDRLLNGQAIIADGPILPGTWAFYEGIEHLAYDPQAALEAIKKAGYTIPAEGGTVRQKEGQAFSFEMVYPDDALHSALFQAIQGDWARLGIEVKPRPVTYDELVDNYLEPRTYQAALVDLNLSRFPDPDPYPFWAQAQVTGGQNYARWSDRQASEFLERARITVDLEERARAYRNFQVRFTAEMPALPLYYPVYTYAVDRQVQGVRMGPLFDLSDRFATLATWYILARPASGIGPTPTP